MRRLVVFPQPTLWRTRSGFQTQGPVPLVLAALQPHFERVTACARVVDDPDFAGEPLPVGVHVHPLPPYRTRLEFVARVPECRRGIREAAAAADVALVVLPGYEGALASWLCQRSGVRTFHWVVGDWPRVVLSRRRRYPQRLWGLALQPILRTLVRRLTRDSLSFWNGGSEDATHPLYHHACTTTTLSARDLVAPGERHAIPWRLLYAGRLSPEKGLPVLLGAVAQLAQSGRPVTLDVAGEGPLRPELERRVRQLGLDGRVRFLGYVQRGPGLWQLFDRAATFVLASFEDMQPRVLLEAMARRVPVVATDVGNVRSVLRPEVTGLLAPPADSGALAQAIERMLDDSSLRKRLVTAGAELAARHTIEIEIARMIGIAREHFAGRVEPA